MHLSHSAVGAILVAAGKGSRMGLGYNKVLLPLCGKPVIQWTLEAFAGSGLVDVLVLVISPEDEGAMADICHSVRRNFPSEKTPEILTVFGGADRQDSVYNGLCALPQGVDVVLVHDGARPFVDGALIERSIDNARAWGAACAGMPVKDTIKVVDENRVITQTPDRARLWSAQTPQAFRREIVTDSYHKAYREGIRGTDDAGLVEAAGYRVTMFEGSYGNIKLTSAEDLLFAERLLREKKSQT
jgi:2-C-methyl-D-erythritol 4-phosphate cytidylyltransferase